MNIIIWGVRIIEDSDNRGSDNRGCTVFDIGVRLDRVFRNCGVPNSEVLLCNWASEASPTLGCSIEISRDICCRYVSYVKLTA